MKTDAKTRLSPWLSILNANRADSVAKRRKAVKESLEAHILETDNLEQKQTIAHAITALSQTERTTYAGWHAENSTCYLVDQTTAGFKNLYNGWSVCVEHTNGTDYRVHAHHTNSRETTIACETVKDSQRKLYSQERSEILARAFRLTSSGLSLPTKTLDPDRTYYWLMQAISELDVWKPLVAPDMFLHKTDFNQDGTREISLVARCQDHNHNRGQHIFVFKQLASGETLACLSKKNAEAVAFRNICGMTTPNSGLYEL